MIVSTRIKFYLFGKISKNRKIVHSSFLVEDVQKLLGNCKDTILVKSVTLSDVNTALVEHLAERDELQEHQDTLLQRIFTLKK